MGQSFANVAATSDTFEIETSKLALAKASSVKVKTFARQMIGAHTDSTAKLKAAAAAATRAITPVPALTAAREAKLDALQGYSAGGDLPSLNAFAKQLVPLVTAHLNMAKGL
ncbi:DUF4142 domain-containing protein [Novosphingobium sp. BL-52-GroH]|uniref:DUF4142 domain-containing protein n=1 Tax=Novosphingobium sp. BL-52-GroH TaxID=3349877 RepID=UPI00384AD649